MPNRYIREAAIASKAMNSLSWQGEVFCRRLWNKVDDFGRFTADPELLRTEIFPRQLDKVRETDISRLLAECEKAGLLFVYSAASKAFLVMNQWEQGRAKSSKYPPPTPDVCKRMQTHVYIGEQMSPSPTPTQTPSPSPAPTPFYKDRQLNQSGLNGQAAGPDLTKLTKSACERVGTEIVDNHRGWAYDNCKVQPSHFVRKSLVTELDKWVGVVTEKQVHAAWQEAVTRTHKAVVDGVTAAPLASVAGYCIVCFREALAAECGRRGGETDWLKHGNDGGKPSTED